MAIRNSDEDYSWVFARDLRAQKSLVEDDDSTLPKLSDTLIEAATVIMGFAGIILLIGAVVTALN